MQTAPTSSPLKGLAARLVTILETNCSRTMKDLLNKYLTNCADPATPLTAPMLPIAMHLRTLLSPITCENALFALGRRTGGGGSRAVMLLEHTLRTCWTVTEGEPPSPAEADMSRLNKHFYDAELVDVVEVVAIMKAKPPEQSTVEYLTEKLTEPQTPLTKAILEWLKVEHTPAVAGAATGAEEPE